MTAHLPALTNIGSGLTLENGGAVTVPLLRNINGASLSAQNGSVLSLPNVTSLVINRAGTTFSAHGAGSLIDLAHVTNVFVTPDAWFAVQARYGGQVDLRGLESISGGSSDLWADGSGSLLRLTRLSGFSTPLGASSLRVENEGVVQLNEGVFLLANVAVSVGDLVVSAEPALVLHAPAWRSYQVETRDARVPGSAWRLWARVPQTNVLQALSGPPPEGQAFRVREFVADPPVVDLHRMGPQLGRMVLYGVRGQTYRVESRESLGPMVPWAPWSGSVTLTNSFRWLTPVPIVLEPERYFRGRMME
jgi:hypothetical protein